MTDADDGLKTIVTSQQYNSSSDEETKHENKFHSEVQSNNGTNDINSIQAKFSLNKYNNNNEATTEKLQLKAEKIVDNYPVASEPHEANNAIGDNIYSDVDTNFIDVGQQVPRNNSSKFQFDKRILYNFLFEHNFRILDFTSLY